MPFLISYFFHFEQIQAANDVINESWNEDEKSSNLATSIGIMIYEGAESLKLVKNFVNGTDLGGGTFKFGNIERREWLGGSSQ